MPRSMMVAFRRLLFIISRLYFPIVSCFFTFVNYFCTKRCVHAPEDKLLLISATEAAKMIRNREITSVDLIKAYVKRINEVNDIINAVVQMNFEDALVKAQEVDELLDNLDRSTVQFKNLVLEKPLLGVPFTLKDSIEADSLYCTIGILSRKNIVSKKDAVVVQRMKDAGAILLAVTNVPEVCMWWESFNVIYGRTKNPYDSRRIAGGSSGGEAALVASAGSVIGIGSDIAGSIRMPSYFNGIFGLKPTPGVVPIEGHLPLIDGYRTDKMLCIGPICRYAKDLPLLLRIFAGSEGMKLLQLHNSYNMKKIRLFYMEGLKTPLVPEVNEECYRALRKETAIKWFKKSHAVRYLELKYNLSAIRVDLPFAHYALEFFLTSMEDINAPKFSMYMADLKGDVNCFVETLKWLVGNSDHTLPAIITGIADEYFAPFTEKQKQKLKNQRDRLIREVTELLSNDAVLLFPAFPTVAPYHHQPLFVPLNFGYTALWNTLAVPVIQCPVGLNDYNIPLGVQVIGAPGSDFLLISVAQDLEEAFGGWKALQK
ncbi:unnamed protein product [Thelazia callipaeda]|uniref:Amidase domain-containing protein n=1 Tax=Thelazia callipaeda TaxID=103827 RepID=A0A0N5CJV5_THECL|nr:unnamed protein product [Thelazia callipaeda]